MRKIITILTIMFFIKNLLAQVPNKMSYQAVVRNASNILVVNQPIGMKISILNGSINGNPVYIETQNPISNSNGLVSIEIGSGTIVSGSFAAIDWSNGNFYIKTETDPLGGSNYSISGTSQLLSVPFSFISKTSQDSKKIKTLIYTGL